MTAEELALIEKTKDLLCAPHYDLICKCAAMGNCGACKTMQIARLWIKAFGERPCKHPVTYETGLVSDPDKRCAECLEILGKVNESHAR